MRQADHTPLDVWLLDEEGKPAKPYLTAIEDDYSRMIVGYRLSFQPATALTNALTPRQAIWRKEDPRWSACGIPSVFYTDHGSDFTSKHMEQVAADIRMVLVFSEKGVPRGRGKVERFFRSVDQLFLQDVPGMPQRDIAIPRRSSPYRLLSSAFGHGCWKTIIAGSIAKRDTNPRNDGKPVALCLGCLSLSNNSTCCC